MACAPSCSLASPIKAARVTIADEGTFSPQKQHICLKSSWVIQSEKSGRRDLNPRPLEPHSSALPSCATARWNEYCLPLPGRRQTFPSETMKAMTATRMCACSIAVAILLSAIGAMRAQPRTRLNLNEDGFAFAVQLVQEGHFIADDKGGWSEHRPSADEENEFIRVHGFREYAKWHLGIDERYPENTKRRYKFPYGDFKNVHRCGVLAVRARSRQYHHADIENAVTKLISLIENKRTESARGRTFKTWPGLGPFPRRFRLGLRRCPSAFGWSAANSARPLGMYRLALANHRCNRLRES